MVDPIIPDGNTGGGEEKDKEIADLKAKLAGVGNDMADLRKKKQDAEAERDAAIAKATAAVPQDATEAVRAVLAEQAKADAATARTRAEEKFKNLHKEFHPDNDPGGLKYAALQQKLNRLNADGLKSEEDFLGLMDDAYTLVDPSKRVQQAENFAPYASSQSAPSSGPREADNNQLSGKEKRLIGRLGWDEKKYLEQKAKRPTYIRQLLEQSGEE